VLRHGSRGGEEDESAHRMQHVYTAGGCLGIYLMLLTTPMPLQNFEAMRQMP
jgi:hypothetical protein